MAVVPDPSARVTTVISPEGIFNPGFNKAIRLSFQFVTVPINISDNRSLDNFNWPAFIPSILTTGTTPPIMAGN